jgi:hypothetical protein
VGFIELTAETHIYIYSCLLAWLASYLASPEGKRRTESYKCWKRRTPLPLYWPSDFFLKENRRMIRAVSRSSFRRVERRDPSNYGLKDWWRGVALFLVLVRAQLVLKTRSLSRPGTANKLQKSFRLQLPDDATGLSKTSYQLRKVTDQLTQWRYESESRPKRKVIDPQETGIGYSYIVGFHVAAKPNWTTPIADK